MRKITSKDIKKHFIMTITVSILYFVQLSPQRETKFWRIHCGLLLYIIANIIYCGSAYWNNHKFLFLTLPTVTNGNFHILTTTKYCVHRLSTNYFLSYATAKQFIIRSTFL